MTTRANKDRIRSAKGERRKALWFAMLAEVRKWREEGKPGDLIVGEIEQKFFSEGDAQ